VPEEQEKRQGLAGRMRRALRLTPERSRLLKRLGIVAAVIVVFAVIPAYYALQPGFVTRYPNLLIPHATWSRSTHKAVSCQSCHVPPTVTAQSVYAVRMLGQFYVSLVMPSKLIATFDRPTNAACQHCHVELVKAAPKGDLRIPHAAHVDVLKLQCIQCHAFLVHETSPEGKHTPPMAACLKCHDGVQAKNACVTCHTAKAAPDSHKAADWVRIHPQEQASADCAKCHGWTKDWCADCHSRRPPSHTADWRTTHAAAVKIHRNCEACHVATFCINCHGDVPMLNFDPKSKLAVTPTD